jgi:hypothetical protein
MKYHFFGWVLITLAFSVLPQTSAQEWELVSNGGFEQGLQEWEATYAYSVAKNEQGYYDAQSHPPHSGQFSAKVGTASQAGMLSQVVTIPLKSTVVFSAWYRIEQGAGLAIVLKTSDGSTIQQWLESGSRAWSQVTYDVSPALAGQPITIEFDGQGSEQLTTVMHNCTTPSGSTYPCATQRLADYFAFVDDVSMRANAEYTASATVAGLPSTLSSNLYVDGASTGSLNGGESQQLSFTIGDTHTISVDDYVYQDNTTRYHCESSAFNVTMDTQLTFTYKIQFYLSVSSPFGTSQGAGWYDEGSRARFSLNLAAFPMPGLAGLLGARYVFDKWTGDASTNEVQSSVIIDRPRSVSATWKEDYSTPYLLATVITISVLVALAVYRYWSRKQKKTMGFEEPIVIEIPPRASSSYRVTCAPGVRL